MTKSIKNYMKALWLKAIDDKLTRTEMIVIFGVIFGIALVVVNVVDNAIFTVVR